MKALCLTYLANDVGEPLELLLRARHPQEVDFLAREAHGGSARLEHDVLENGGKGRHAYAPAHKHGHFVAVPVLVSLAERAVQVQLESINQSKKQLSHHSV